MKHFATLLFTLALLAACEGPEGPVGPQGPAGPAGAQGPPGASVGFEVVTFTVQANQFSSGGTIESYTRSMSEITRSVMSSGAVLAYTDLGTTAWTALPVVLAVSGNVASLTYGYAAGTFELVLTHEASGTFAGAFDGHRIRVVILEEPPAAKKPITYDALRALYGLPE